METNIDYLVQKADSNNRYCQSKTRLFKFHIHCKNLKELSLMYSFIHEVGLEQRYKEESISLLCKDISFLYSENNDNVKQFVEKVLSNDIMIRS